MSFLTSTLLVSLSHFMLLVRKTLNTIQLYTHTNTSLMSVSSFLPKIKFKESFEHYYILNHLPVVYESFN